MTGREEVGQSRARLNPKPEEKPDVEPNVDDTNQALMRNWAYEEPAAAPDPDPEYDALPASEKMGWEYMDHD